jgi:hypothetical protein
MGTTAQVIITYLRKVYDNLGVSDRLEPFLYCLYRELLNKCWPTNPQCPLPQNLCNPPPRWQLFSCPLAMPDKN